ATAAAVTVTATLAVRRGSDTDVAVMLAVPAAIPRITAAVVPFAVTDATPAFDVVHVTSGDAPFTAAAVAVTACVAPTAIDAVGGDTVTPVTPATVMFALAAFDASA